MSSGEGSASKKKRGKYGNGSLRQRENGKYEYRFRYSDEYGMRRSKTVTGKTIGECLDRADDFKEKLSRMSGGFGLDTTIPDILYWKAENDFAKNYTGEQGYDRKLRTIRIIEKSPIGWMPIASIRPEHVDAFMRSITHYANTVIQKIHAMIKTAFRIAFDCRIIDVNFMTRDDMRCPKSDKPDKKVRGFTEKEQEAFVKTLIEHKDRCGWNSYKLQLLIELYSGMRMGEINALKEKDIDFENGYIHVCRTVSRGIGYRPFLKEGTKTDAGVRDVPISGLLEPVLRKAISEKRKNPYGLLFYDYRNGKVVETHQVNSLFRRICEKAGIEHMGQHALRHTFATRCIEAGVSPLVLKTWLGHTNIHITLDTYADVFARLNLGSVSLLEKHMSQISPVMISEGQGRDSLRYGENTVMMQSVSDSDDEVDFDAEIQVDMIDDAERGWRGGRR